MRRVSVVALVAAGLILIAVGTQKWFEARSAEQAVHQFMEAVRDGRREQVLSLLTPAERRKWESRHADDARLFSLPEPGLDYRIHSLQMSGAAAVAELRIEKSGFEIKPRLLLARGQSTTWKIDRVDNLHVDPRWDDALERQGQQDGETLATELARLLEDHPGITVHRESGAGFLR